MLEALPYGRFVMMRYFDTHREYQFHPKYSSFSLLAILLRVGLSNSLLNRELTGNFFFFVSKLEFILLSTLENPYAFVTLTLKLTGDKRDN